MNVYFNIQYHLFFRKELYFWKCLLFISVNTILECRYMFFDWERVHQLSPYSNGERTRGGITFHVYMRTCIISFIFLIAFLHFSVLFYLWEFNFIQKRCVRQKRLLFSSKINFCCKLFFLKIILANEKLTKTLLILIKYNHF